jgi:hypothetical protein
MKKYTILILTLVLIAALFAGCRKNVGTPDTEPSRVTEPTIIPTVPTTPTDATVNDPTGQTDATSGTDSQGMMDDIMGGRNTANRIY